jgi:hypothetical protein
MQRSFDQRGVAPASIAALAALLTAMTLFEAVASLAAPAPFQQSASRTELASGVGTGGTVHPLATSRTERTSN